MFLIVHLGVPTWLFSLAVCLSRSRCKGTAAALRPTNKQTTSLHVVEHKFVPLSGKDTGGGTFCCSVAVVAVHFGVVHTQNYTLYYLYIYII